jgi:hypothetical protein
MILGIVTDTAIKLFVCGLVWHWFADWILQNDWMAKYKVSLLHPASWVHSGIHLLGLLFIFPAWWMAVLIAITHILIDTRVPLVWWRKFYRQTTEGPVAIDVAIWGDQVCHYTVLALAALIVGRL